LRNRYIATGSSPTSTFASARAFSDSPCDAAWVVGSSFLSRLEPAIDLVISERYSSRSESAMSGFSVGSFSSRASTAAMDEIAAASIIASFTTPASLSVSGAAKCPA